MNFVAYGLSLPGIAGRADHKEVSEGCDLTEVEHAEISSFFGFGCPNSRRPVAAFVFGLGVGWQRSAGLNCRKALLRLGYYIPRPAREPGVSRRAGGTKLESHAETPAACIKSRAFYITCIFYMPLCLSRVRAGAIRRGFAVCRRLTMP